jgi:hypothetical protein
MRIEIEVELSEKVEPDNHVERRRFLRDVEMELPEIGHQFELNVNKELIMVTVESIARDAADGLYHIRIRSDSLTFASLREDERWIEKLL